METCSHFKELGYVHNHEEITYTNSPESNSKKKMVKEFFNSNHLKEFVMAIIWYLFLGQVSKIYVNNVMRKKPLSSYIYDQIIHKLWFQQYQYRKM